MVNDLVTQALGDAQTMVNTKREQELATTFSVRIAILVHNMLQFQFACMNRCSTIMGPCVFTHVHACLHLSLSCVLWHEISRATPHEHEQHTHTHIHTCLRTQNLFDMLDIDKGGTLDVDGELLQAMQRLGQNIILNDLRMAMERVCCVCVPVCVCACAGDCSYSFWGVLKSAMCKVSQAKQRVRQR
jgi:hypothetical protein